MSSYRKVLLLIVVILVAWSFVRFVIPHAPLLSDYSFSTAVYDRNKELLRLTLSRDDKFRIYTPLKKIAPAMIDATLFHEDRYFHYHLGINPIAMTKAFHETFVKKGVKRGASTITMQLARLKYKIDSKNILGKIYQIFKATQMELFHSKDEILEAYLNLAPYGGNIEGVGAASLVYFEKQPDKLSLPEVLSLTVIPQNPSFRGPQEGKMAERLSLARQKLYDHLAPKYKKASTGLADIQPKMKNVADLPFEAPHFVDDVISKVEGIKAPEIVTTLDLKYQQTIERIVKSYVKVNNNIGVYNASVLLIYFPTMEVKTLVGSADFFNKEINGQVNFANAKRSPGSTLKPFVYGLAFDQGLIHPLTMLKDAPLSWGSYDPENFDGRFLGPITVHDALIRSRNVPAVTVAGRLKDDGLYGFLRRAHVTKLREPEFYGLSVAIGGAETSMEELTKLYAMLGNEGDFKGIRKLTSDKNEKGERLLSRESAFMVLDILKDNPRTGREQRGVTLRDEMPVYWKTGTSFAFRDAWAAGLFGSYAMAVWVGNFNGSSNPTFVGRDIAGPLFFQVVDAIMAKEGATALAASFRDINVRKVEVCSISGSIPMPYCRHKINTWFIPGVSPIEPCSIHRMVSVDKATGLRTCSKFEGDTKEEVFEFWPSDLASIFRQAGIPRRDPPPYHPMCRFEDKDYYGLNPSITSPKSDITYQMRSDNFAKESIQLAAVADADVKKLYWFVNESYVGVTSPGQMFSWQPKIGDFLVRAVDDFGRSASRKLKVVMVH